MNKPAISRPFGRIAGCMIALLAGLGTVALSNAASITSGGFEGLVARWPVLATQVALVSLPFLVLALVLRFGRPAWLTAAVLTAIVWTLPAADHALRQGEGGANIGLGIFMLVSPLLVLGGALAASAAAGRRRK